MRSIRSEILGFSLVMALPVSLLVIFPKSAIGFKAKPTSEKKPSFAWVRLSSAAESVAINIARVSWSMNANYANQLRESPMMREMPRKDMAINVVVPPVAKAIETLPPLDNPGPWRPSVAAPQPGNVKSSAPVETVQPAFSREELLDLK